jgi:hypothetical protein
VATRWLCRAKVGFANAEAAVSRITEIDGVVVALFDGFRLPLPDGCRDCGKRKRKFGRTQPDQALRRSPRPSRSSARRARHALRKERLRVAPRGCALPLTAAATGAQ